MSIHYVDEVPIDTDTEHDDDGDDGTTYINVGISNPNGSHVSGSAAVPDTVTADEVARLIVRAALGAAAAHGTDTWIALQQLITPSPPGVTG